MAKAPLNNKSNPSKLQKLLPTLTNKEIKDMYHAKVNLVLNMSTKSASQIEDLKTDIDILAAEMKLRNMDMRARSPSRKCPMGSPNEGYESVRCTVEEKAQYAEIAKAKNETVRHKTDSRSIYKKTERLPYNDVESLAVPKKGLGACTKNIVISKTTEMKKVSDMKHLLSMRSRFVEKHQLVGTGKVKEADAPEKSRSERPKYNLTSVSPTMKFIEKVEIPSTRTVELKGFAVYNKTFVDGRKKLNVFWPPEEEDHSTLKQKIRNYLKLRGKESHPRVEQVDYKKLKENHDELVKEYPKLSRPSRELPEPVEEDNLFSLAVRPTREAVETLYLLSSIGISEDTLDSVDFALDVGPSQNMVTPKNMTLRDFMRGPKKEVRKSAGQGSKTIKNEADKSVKANHH